MGSQDPVYPDGAVLGGLELDGDGRGTLELELDGEGAQREAGAVSLLDITTVHVVGALHRPDVEGMRTLIDEPPETEIVIKLPAMAAIQVVPSPAAWPAENYR